MRIAWFLPLAFMSGEHGFALFAPYLLLIGAVAGLRRFATRRVPAPAPVLSELEAAPV